MGNVGLQRGIMGIFWGGGNGTVLYPDYDGSSSNLYKC